MSIDAMRRALEALEWAGDQIDPVKKSDCDCPLCTACLALDAAIEQAEKQEPVAFFDPVARRLRQNPAFQVGVSVATWHGEIPLYTAPPQRQPDYVWCGCGDGIMPNTGAKCGTCASIDAAPPQRQPLTEEEIKKAPHHMVDGAYYYSFRQGVRFAERKHGIGGGE